MAKQKQLDVVVAEGLTALFDNQKFSIVQSAAITEAFVGILATVRLAENLDKRVRKLETATKMDKAKPLRLAS